MPRAKSNTILAVFRFTHVYKLGVKQQIVHRNEIESKRD